MSTPVFPTPAQPSGAQAPTQPAVPASTPAQSAPATSTPMALDPAAAAVAAPPVRVVDEPVALNTMMHDPVALVNQFQLRLEESQRQLAEVAAQNKAFQERESARAAAEQAAADKARADAEASRKAQISDAARKLEAGLEAAIKQIRANDPEQLSDEDANMIKNNFTSDVQRAGFDEAQLESLALKTHQQMGILVKASERAAATRAELNQREMSKAAQYLRSFPAQSTSFAVSGGFQPQQQAVPAPTPVPIPQQQHQAPPTDAGGDFGTHLASKMPSGGIFGSMLGKRSSSTADEYAKRSFVSETVPHNGLPQQAPVAPTDPVDLTARDWAKQVILASIMAGEGVPTAQSLRHGGFKIVQKHTASANGGIMTQNMRVPRSNEMIDRPLTMKDLDPEGFDKMVEQVRSAFAHNGTRPQLREMTHVLEAADHYAQRNAANRFQRAVPLYGNTGYY